MTSLAGGANRALACSDPPEGYGRWSLRLLADRVVEGIHFDKVRRILKKTNFNLTRSEGQAGCRLPGPDGAPVAPVRPPGVSPTPLLPDWRSVEPFAHGTRAAYYAYQKNVSCSLFLAFEPVTGRRWIQVYARRSGREYTRFMQYLQEQFPQAQRIRLVQDNLFTHSPASAQAFALMERWEWNNTPPRASRLNMVEIELSALSRQCLQRRIGTREEVRAWVAERNRRQVTVRWQFTVHDARQKFANKYVV